jgi:hypothetical protein
MKKIKFEELKQSIFDEELALLEDMYSDKQLTYDEKEKSSLEIIAEFELINDLNNLHDYLMGCGFDEDLAYERIINHLVEEPKP